MEGGNGGSGGREEEERRQGHSWGWKSQDSELLFFSGISGSWAHISEFTPLAQHHNPGEQR